MATWGAGSGYSGARLAMLSVRAFQVAQNVAQVSWAVYSMSQKGLTTENEGNKGDGHVY